MFILCRNLILFVLITSLLGCESKKLYDIPSDPMLVDLSERVSTIDGELAALKKDMEDIRKLLKENGDDIDFELKGSLKKELLEGDVHEKNILQWVSYLKIQRKQRYSSLMSRKDQETLVDEAKKESDEYFLHKKLNPIKKPWLTRYRTAIEL